MKFAHMADCHIGGWKDLKLTELSLEAFREAVKICIEENVAFILISGDLFDTALPSIDLLREVAKELNKVRENNIEVYTIPGSHDFSPSGKTMLDVLEKAGLVYNVNKFKENRLIFTEDKTGVKITGLLGRRGGLERLDYERLEKEGLENEKGFKIFMFHTMLEEFKPEDMKKVEGMLTASLPKNFNYYAGGHVHYIFNKRIENGLIVFPGALFPNNFAEIEKFKYGGFYIVDDRLNLKYKDVKLKDVLSLEINGKNADEINKKIKLKIEENGFKDKIVTLRVNGVLEEGKISDIKFRDFIKEIEERGAYYVMKNTNKLVTKEFQEFDIKGDVEDIEEKILEKHLGQVKMFSKEDEGKIVKELMDVLNVGKKEGETVNKFEERLMRNLLKTLKLEDILK